MLPVLNSYIVPGTVYVLILTMVLEVKFYCLHVTGAKTESQRGCPGSYGHSGTAGLTKRVLHPDWAASRPAPKAGPPASRSHCDAQAPLQSLLLLVCSTLLLFIIIFGTALVR